MVKVHYEAQFEKKIRKIIHAGIKQQVKKHLLKIIENPLIGKPMRYQRRETRETYIEPFRLSYAYDENTNTVIFLDIYHKDEQ